LTLTKAKKNYGQTAEEQQPRCRGKKNDGTLMHNTGERGRRGKYENVHYKIQNQIK
jgi:hypothetical protein